MGGGGDTLTELNASDGSLVGTYPTAGPLNAVTFDGSHIWAVS